MGCFHSKKEISDLHPNIFRVVNIDESGVDLCSGQLEITDSDIILYREGRDCTVWPLHSLRRYGFEEDLFRRRCETGEGIYAFRCRRASVLFRTLQQQIQLRNVVHDSVPFPVSRMTSSSHSRQTLQASVIHRSSVDNGPPDTTLRSTTGMPMLPCNTARTSPNADILEVTPLYPRSQTNTHATNVYQVNDFKREHNNNQAESSTETGHAYTNDLNRDLAMLRKTLRREMALTAIRDIEDETRFLQGRYLENEDASTSEKVLDKTDSDIKEPTTPTKDNDNVTNDKEQLAPATGDTETSARYMNMIPKEQSPPETIKEPAAAIAAPVTPVMPYCNLTLGSSIEVNSYANLLLGEIPDVIKKREHQQKFSESDTFTSMSPVEDMEVNYAVLDIDTNREFLKTETNIASPETQSFNSSKNDSTTSHSSHARSRVVSQNSIDKSSSGNAVTSLTSIGYTTIDFDKTVALTSVAAAADANLDACRKSRHNSCVIIYNPSDKK
ncbi:unnamed protein product [Leptidea sinapis]|uniref:IRS-type PTB domain-containing protein n=1 Tax=Leptidea sinapis TaxID=189913 RepID=A0A5E4PXI7_9NEOP|nr:unnamed protein product [Leptidea sinapis]